MEQSAHLERKDLKNKTKRKLDRPEKLPKNNSSLAIFLLGLVIFFVGALNYIHVRRLSFYHQPSPLTTNINSDPPVEIIIPSINIDKQVESGAIDKGIWQISKSSATFLSSSASPADGGNTVIYGHNLKSVFANLPYLSIGEKIIIKSKSGKFYNYKVDKKYFVNPDRVDLVSPSKSPELTVYTCWGLFDSQRSVIKAVPI